MTRPQNISRAQLLLWHRRVLTEHALGSSPQQALDVLKSMLSAQVHIDGAEVPAVDTIPYERSKTHKGA